MHAALVRVRPQIASVNGSRSSIAGRNCDPASLSNHLTGSFPKKLMRSHFIPSNLLISFMPIVQSTP